MSFTSPLRATSHDTTCAPPALRFIPRFGPPSAAATVLAKHTGSYSARMADRVVHATAWSDNALDVLFGDGTVLAFADSMNTFVAFSPPGASGSHSATVREMQYTRWAMSTYRAKVAAALSYYNYYMPSPRLFTEFIDASSVEAWPHAGPVDALVLSRDAALLERRPVYKSVSVDAAEARERQAQLRAGTTPEPLVVAPSFPLSEVDVLSASVDPDRTVAAVCVGVEVTLWCALRRTSLTIDSRRRVFTVRWPAPVSTPPPRSRHEGSASWCAAEVLAHDAIVHKKASHQQRGVVWLEQCFPVSAPPPAWAAMLQLALELHESTPLGGDACDGMRVTAPAPCQSRSDLKEETKGGCGADVEPLAAYSQLPAPLPTETRPTGRSGALFSSMQAEHADVLRAHSLHQRSEWFWQREVHGTTGYVLWRIDMDPTSDAPPAVYWCIDPGTATSMTPAPGIGEAGPSTSLPCVCAVVREDESVVWLQPHGSGYGLVHASVDGHTHSYHVNGDGSAGLPPVITALSFADYRLEPATPSRDYEGGTRWVPGECVLTLSHPPTDALSTHQRQQSSLPLCSRRDRPRAFPPAASTRRNAWLTCRDEHACQRYDTDAEDAEEAERALFWDRRGGRGAGHYLQAVGRVCVQLLEWARGSARASRGECAALHGQSVRWRSSASSEMDTTAANAAILAERNDGSLFRHFVGAAPTRAPSSSAALKRTRPATATDDDNDSIVFLTTRLEGIANFTALMNGVVRCQFNDRTLLTLIPGLNEFDEEDLVASCLFRDATRCVMRVSQCRSQSHALFRYLAYALPFRRYVLMEAAARRHGYPDLTHESDFMRGDTPGALADSSVACLLASHHDLSGVATAASALTSFNVNGSPSQCLSDRLDDEGFGIRANSADRLHASSAPMMESSRADDASQGQLGPAPALSLYLTTLEDTVEQQERDDLSVLEARNQRIQSLLDESAQLRQLNAALLSGT